MDNIKFRISLNKGRDGIPLDKLGSIAEATKQFLKSLCKDIDLPQGEWIAKRFTNGSLGYDHVFVGEYAEDDTDKFGKAFLHVVSTDPSQETNSGGLISHETMIQYADIAKHIDVDEKIEFGIYNGSKRPKYKPLTKSIAEGITKIARKTVKYQGGVYGTINALFKEQDPHFTLRETLSDDLIRCYYSDVMYADIHKAIERKDATVYVHGLVTANAYSEKIQSLEVDAIRAAPILLDEEYKAFFGCAPNMTADSIYGD